MAAQDLLEESVVVARSAGDPIHLSSTLRSLGRARLLGGREPVLEVLHESLELSRGLGDRPGIVRVPRDGGARGRPAQGRGADRRAEAAREAAGAAGQPDEETWVVETKAALRDSLGEGAYAAATRAGGALALPDAVARALAT